MKKISSFGARLIAALAVVLCITVTTTAQTNPATSKEDSAKITELPTLPLASPASEQHRDSINEQSIMFLHMGKKPTSHFQLNSRPRLQTTGDPMINIRDHIVRKRRINEGHPLPPPTPVMRRY